MNKHILQGKWNQIKGSIKKEWGDITDKDLDRVNGQYDQLIGLLQEKYGYTLDKAEAKLNDLVDKFSSTLDIDTDQLIKTGKECLNNWERKVQKNALQSLLIAFGVGFLVERLLRWFSSSK